MVILVAVTLSFIITIIYGIHSCYGKQEPKKYIQRCIISGIILIPVVGLSEGTFYSHGIDIHWFVFGVVNFIVIFITSLILVGMVKLHDKITKK